ncbi:la-related protein 4-like isoform X3 [Paramacrobiotus metropolitanus]|uniref:la-related protein 4-like isoform X3 n=1 Tax=Paramacrobiotus metropolitanus TaxID=2943436 RepID=UPI0024461AEF|nr:la-related protein 4-like isoform X3 [Paramacrobiotus metropolitanus]
MASSANAVPWVIWWQTIRRNSHMGMPVGLPQGVEYNLQPKQHFSQDLQYIPMVAPGALANGVAQPWLMHPNEPAMLPQIGNMPMSSFSSSRGSPDGSDYGSSVASNAELSAAAVPISEMHVGRENAIPDNPEVLAAIRTQIEYYFSKQNLARDTYLLSKMDGDGYVEITLIAGFKMVAKWTGDIGLITTAIKSSPKLELDITGMKVRGVQNQVESKLLVPDKQRTTVVIHDLLEDVKKEDIEDLFAKTNFKPVGYECADKTCWYVDFEEEADALEAVRYLRDEIREILGKPICVRIRAIPATVMNTYKGVDNVSPGPGMAGPLQVPVSGEEAMHMIQNPSELLSNQQYPMFAPMAGANAPFYPMTMGQAALNQGLLVFPAAGGGYSHAYVDPTTYVLLNQMNFMPQAAAVPPAAPPMYRNTGHHMNRGRGGGRRGGGMSGWNDQRNNSRYQRGGSSIPNSGRNSAMSESRLDYNNSNHQLSPDQNHSRHGSFSSMNGNYGASSPVVVRSGSNTPPQQEETQSVAQFGHEERRNTFPNSRKPKRPSSEIQVQVQSNNDSQAPSVSQSISTKENSSKFDLEATMFPPLPGLSPLEIAAGATNVSQSAVAHSVNISAADVVRGVVSPKAGQQPGKLYADSECSTDIVERGRNQSSGHNFWGHQADKKEQGSSTDDLPKSGREVHGVDGRARSDGSTDRSRANSSAATQTAATVSPVPGEHHSQGCTGSATPHGSPINAPMSPVKSPGKKIEVQMQVADGTRSPDKQLVKTSQMSSPPKSEDAGSASGAAEGVKGVSLAENGKSGTVSYARVAQMNRDKLLPPASASVSSSSAASNRGPPLTKQSSLDSSGHSQEDRRSVKQEWNHVEVGGGGPKGVAHGATFFERNEGTVNGIHDSQYLLDSSHINGGVEGEMGKEEGQESNDTEGFTEVTKHHKAHVRHDRHHRATGPMRYSGGSS